MVADYVLDQVLERIKRKKINSEEFDNIKILVDTDDILSDKITLKNAAALKASVIKDDGKSTIVLRRSIVL